MKEDENDYNEYDDDDEVREEVGEGVQHTAHTQ